MTKKHFYLFFLLFSTLIQPVYSYPFSLVINEFVASNKTGITSIEGKAEDWIEIYNPTDQEINLAGWSLTDDQSKPTKFTFPADKYIPIRSNGYFLLYASGSTNAIVSGEWHVNFSLSKSGEYLALITPDGIIADEITNVNGEICRSACSSKASARRVRFALCDACSEHGLPMDAYNRFDITDATYDGQSDSVLTNNINYMTEMVETDIENITTKNVSTRRTGPNRKKLNELMILSRMWWKIIRW